MTMRIRLARVCRPDLPNVGYQSVMTAVMMIFFTIRNGLFGKTQLYQGRQLIMLTGQLETGIITVDDVRSPKVKMTLQAIKILVQSTSRSQN